MLLERDDQLRLLRDIATGVPSTGGKVVLVRGEAGIGKSALVRAFTAVHAGSGPVHIGTCDDLRIPRALNPFWDIARDHTALLEPLQSADRAKVLEELLRLLSDPRAPTVMILEDTHWADEATLDTIRYVGRRIGRTNGVLLLTYRDGEVDVNHPLRGVVGDIPVGDVVRIQLDGLSLDSVQQLIGEVDLDARTVRDATQGNPFLVGEMIATTQWGRPPSLDDAVLARVQRLTYGSQDALKTLSVIPEPISREEALGLATVDDDRLDECEARGLLDCGGHQVMFRHALIRQAMRDSLTAGERQARNRIVLRDLPESTHPCLIIDLAVEAGDIDRLLQAVPRSARYAAAVGSHVQAVGDFRELGPYLDRLDPAELGPLLEDWAREESIVGRTDDAIHLSKQACDRYRGVGDRVAESRVLAQMARYLEYDGRRDDADARASEAVEVLGPDPDGPALARALEATTYLRMMVGDVATVPELVEAHAGSRRRWYRSCHPDPVAQSSGHGGEHEPLPRRPPWP